MSKVAPILLLLATLSILSFLLPQSFVRDLVASITLAVLLIAVLLVRSQHWHHGDPYDLLIALFVLTSIGYLATFSGVSHDTIGVALTALLAILSAILALSLLNDLPQPTALMATVPAPRAHTGVQQALNAKKSPAPSPESVERKDARAPRRTLLRRLFRRNLSPIPELPVSRHSEISAAPQRLTRTPSRTTDAPIASVVHAAKPRRLRALLRRVLRRAPGAVAAPTPHDNRTDPVAISAPPTIEPITELVPPRPGKPHTDAFRQGIEPISEVDDSAEDITAEHLHKLGVYDLEPLPEIAPRAVRRTPTRVNVSLNKTPAKKPVVRKKSPR